MTKFTPGGFNWRPVNKIPTDLSRQKPIVLFLDSGNTVTVNKFDGRFYSDIDQPRPIPLRDILGWFSLPDLEIPKNHEDERLLQGEPAAIVTDGLGRTVKAKFLEREFGHRGGPCVLMEDPDHPTNGFVWAPSNDVSWRTGATDRNAANQCQILYECGMLDLQEKKVER